ncbi:unnamed protein product [Parnassius apollo]|uniref:(apollo) hypothetical protein n=1 Tax=Parnassius apollo TaxID=110799 RepID=A0A8S3XTK0_PARAO|nr:unnamed protein product [Parnassius apollo]
MKSIAILYIVLTVIKLSISHCYWSENCHYKYFSSKTPYQFVRGDIRDSVVKIKGCKEISVWGLVRHGKRNPGISFAQNILDAITLKYAIKLNHENGKGSMCAQDVENLYNWEADPNIFKNIHQITEEGYQEMFGLGYRIRKAFKNLLTSLDDKHYKLRSAYGDWIENGVKGFVEGFGNTSMIIEKPNASYDIIAPYEACGFYVKEVRNNIETFAEAYKYQNTSEYLAAKNRIQQRTGINYTLTKENMTALYDLCRYTSSGLNNILSPWCAIFTKEDIQVLEYESDLRHFYRNGYGNHINEIFGRIPLADLLESFKAAKIGERKKLTVYFTHATMMDMVYSALGLFKDDIPLNGTFRNPERKWKSSKLAPFAANLIATLNRCSNGESTDYNVVFYMNEEPLESICNKGVCSWEDFEIRLNPFINTTTNFC